MPLATVHLVALAPQASSASFVKGLASASIRPLVVSRVKRWIIKPEKLSATRLLSVDWDLLIILPTTATIPEQLRTEQWLTHHWSISAGVPSSIVNGFEQRNQKLLCPPASTVPALTGSLERPRITSSTQGLELTQELLDWSKASSLGGGAVSMLNLLSFKPTPGAHESYLVYGRAFSESIGSRRGGIAKIVGKVVRDQNSPGEDKHGWDEIALAHYPSITHFVDMLASEDYQKVNHASRLPALRDTCILCTSELDTDLGTDVARL
ncbi:uncharacterized protein K489DRAFT_389974 [Dissoconium aciculare CBS 342.82]|uniref:DUF1330 domain-containing protein n=1 Tax=Dissoconium aciculare CBS 342.82 TaxID=1314786 RepID=A0A6J3LXW2_9PEZI|nr:uncharacterized protein K489DRAFT_389974 [Dissoconium aciculare CBS 342.82]KAF1820518.1 hypothetical protein K489DRAFT_389974 [Dissoconium aciculare CBS 342.82]